MPTYSGSCHCGRVKFAIESAAAIMQDQSATFGLTRIIGLVEPENHGSVRVLQKFGPTHERRIAADHHGELDLYAIHFEGVR